MFRAEELLCMVPQRWTRVITVVVALVAQACPTATCSLPGSSVHGMLQARILE